MNCVNGLKKSNKGFHWPKRKRKLKDFKAYNHKAMKIY